MSNEKCCGFIVYKLDDDGQKYLLLYQRETETWSFPKGHMMPGETEMQTALRELYEETGLVADPVCGFRKEYSYISGNGNEKNVVLFLTEYWGDDITIGDDIAVYEWVDAGEVVERMAGRNVLPVISAADHYAVSVFLRDLLNGVPCTSGNEFTTKEFLMAFLGNCGELAIQDMDNWFYAVHYEDDTLPWVAVRADMDAILDSEGHPFHGCGHDGHSAVVACLAVLQSALTLNKNIVYIFQPEEETGAGAEKCIPILQKYGVSEIYGFHNIPGYKAGEILIRRGTFACSSFGLVLRFIGHQSHAAYPERAINPCFYAAEFLKHWNSFFDPALFNGVVKGTLVGLNSGNVKFGTTPAFCDVATTLRGEYEEDLDKLETLIYDVANTIADVYDLEVQNLYSDIFPVTANHPELSDKADNVFAELGNITELKTPMLWAEDFGRYSDVCKTYYFGVGSGEEAAELHSDEYEWNDLINWRAIEALRMLTEL